VNNRLHPLSRKSYSGTDGQAAGQSGVSVSVRERLGKGSPVLSATEPKLNQIKPLSGVGKSLSFEGLMPVAHACNPSYSEGRDQEDRGSKPAQANSS
jgi:hypothetical protein